LGAQGRWARLSAEFIDYVDSPEFTASSASKVILGPAPPPSPAGTKGPPAGLPSYLRSLYQTALLTREQEVYLFRRYNYRKYRFSQLRDRLLRRAAPPSVADLDRLESWLDDAVSLRRRLVESNLRLVVHIVKRSYADGNAFFELVSEGNLALMQAVEKFDYLRGVKFGTYAAWVIRRRFARVIPLERCRRTRFVTGSDELLLLDVTRTVNHPTGAVERELTAMVPRWIEQGLDQLPDREREVIRRRFGIGREDGSQTLKDIGRELGITKERVRQIETRALAKLQQIISPEAVEVVYPGLM
jgi:RNA polymerase sigma factor (sigma-70 family)